MDIFDRFLIRGPTRKRDSNSNSRAIRVPMPTTADECFTYKSNMKIERGNEQSAEPDKAKYIIVGRPTDRRRTTESKRNDAMRQEQVCTHIHVVRQPTNQPAVDYNLLYTQPEHNKCSPLIYFVLCTTQLLYSNKRGKFNRSSLPFYSSRITSLRTLCSVHRDSVNKKNRTWK